MQVPGSNNAGPGIDILGLQLMSEGIKTLLEKKKANGIMFGSNFIFKPDKQLLNLQGCQQFSVVTF